MSAFKDHYSGFAETYAKGRLRYPQALFEFLSSLTKERTLAWDCGTGSGQVASDLVNHYRQVIATDPSSGQIRNCPEHARITYRVEQAEESSLRSASADIITIGIALHWFDHERFFQEAKRVLKKEGVIAAWAYFLPVISPEIDKLLGAFVSDPLGPYWREEIRHIHAGYKTIPFPFEEINAPEFWIEEMWDHAQFINHIYTWSAVQLCIEKTGVDPVPAVKKELIMLWGPEQAQRLIRWKMSIIVGRHL